MIFFVNIDLNKFYILVLKGNNMMLENCFLGKMLYLCMFMLMML